MPFGIKVPDYITFIMEKLAQAGFDAWLVGGCIRDILLGLEPKDFDIASSALPWQTEALFDKTAPTGKKYGTVTVLRGGGKAEVTTFRTESGYSDFRRPSNVSFASGIKDDLARRDFTVNAVAYSFKKGFFDPFGGRKDLEQRLIRAVNDPDERFCEDALRMLRAFRFKAQLGFDIEPKTLDAAARHAELVNSISAERIKAELDKILISERPSVICSVLELKIPEVFAGFNISGADMGKLEKVPCCFPARWASLLWLTGACADSVFSSLRFDGSTRRGTTALLSLIGQGIPQNAAEIKKRLSMFGPKPVKLSFDILTALQNQKTDIQEKLLNDILFRGEPYGISMLAVNGDDLAGLGIPAGPECGRLLKYLLEAVIENPELNQKQTLLDIAGGHLQLKV